MNCPHCKQDIETKEPKGYALVSTNGREQKVVDRIELTPEPIFVYVPEKRYKVHAQSIPVICIEERE